VSLRSTPPRDSALLLYGECKYILGAHRTLHTGASRWLNTNYAAVCEHSNALHIVSHATLRCRCKHVSYVRSTNVAGEDEFLFLPYSVFTGRYAYLFGVLNSSMWGRANIHAFSLSHTHTLPPSLSLAVLCFSSP
jgi:hypothetical protein